MTSASCPQTPVPDLETPAPPRSARFVRDAAGQTVRQKHRGTVSHVIGDG